MTMRPDPPSQLRRREPLRIVAPLPLLAVTLMLAFAVPSANAAEHRYRPVKVTASAAVFALDGLVGRDIASARLTSSAGKVRKISAAKVRKAVKRGQAKHRMRVSLSRSWLRSRRSGSTRMTLLVRTRPPKHDPAPPPPPPPATTPPPPPATTPPPPPAPSGTVLWKADAEAPMTSEWASNSSIPAAASPPAPDPSRIYQSTFMAQGARSYRFELRDGDSVFATERAQLGQARPGGPTVGGVDRWFRAGQERWIAMQFYFPSSSWPVGDAWETVFALTPVSDGGAGGNVQLDSGTDRLTFKGQSNVWGSFDDRIFDGGGALSGGAYPLTKDRWIKLTYHIRFSADPAIGFIEVFGDLGEGLGMRALTPLRTRATLKYNSVGAMDPAHMRLGIYRDALLTATQVMYVDGITVGTTREAAETNAFAVG